MIKKIEICVIETRTIIDVYRILKEVYQINNSKIKDISYNPETQRYIITYEESQDVHRDDRDSWI
jgi:hypothetical protein